MATFSVKLGGSALRKLTETAEQIGVTPEQLAEMVLEAWITADGDESGGGQTGLAEPGRAWTAPNEDAARVDQRTTAEDYEGPFVDLDEALDGFSDELNRRLKNPAV